MECIFNIHQILHDEITVIDSSFECLKGVPKLNAERARTDLCGIIDRMGQLSARAQSLACGAITTGMKLMYSDHRLYMLKETAPDTRQVVGILKVGKKRLFVYDMHGVQHELEPLCVLDFYVHESRQRQGCGRRLFDFMLRREGILPRHLAIDRPSHKFSAFLDKHYGLSHVLPQMNNFVVFQGFFRDRTDYPRGRRYRSAVGVDPVNNKTVLNNGLPHRHPEQHSAPPDRRLSPTLPRLPSGRTGRPPAAPPTPLKAGDGLRSHRPPPGALATQETDLRSHRRPPPAPRPEGDPGGIAAEMQALGLRGDAAPGPASASPTSQRAPRPEEAPPGLPREDPLRRKGSLREILNGHQDYLTRDGRLRVGAVGGGRREAQSAPYTPAPVSNSPTGPGSGGYTYQQGLNRNYRHTRLW